MTNISLSRNGSTPFQQLLGHNTNIMSAWNNLGDVLGGDNSLSALLQLRNTLELCYL